MKNNLVCESKARNQTFNYLYALAIIMVIDDHCNSRIGFLTSIFPYDSFFMPLFVFCSGYFYKHNNFISILKHKIKKLLIPYLIWNMVAMVVSLVIKAITGVDWINHNGIYTFIYMFMSSTPTTLNAAAWFVLMLFYVSVGYGLIRNIFKLNKLNDYILTGVFVVLGFFGLFLSLNGYCITTKAINYLFIFISRTLFYIQFYHYGYMFKYYIECHIERQGGGLY